MKMWIKAILGISLSFMCLFTCVGYAAMSQNLVINGNVEAEPPYAVFITSITDGSAVAEGSAAVNHCSGTIANLSLSLGNDSSSSKTLHVTIFNNTIDYHTFKGVLYTEGEHTYSNTNITFEISGFDIGDKLAPGEYAYIDITFSYDSYRGYSETLACLLDFHFGLSGMDEGTDYESYIFLFLTNTNGYGINDSHKGDVVLNSLKENTVIYAGDNLNGGNLKHLLNAVNTAQTENLYFIYQYISDTTINLYTYEDKYNNQEYIEQNVTVYKTTFTRDAIGTTYTEWAPSASINGSAPVKSIVTPMGSNLYAVVISDWKNTQ